MIVAEKIATQLIEQTAAACVNILPNIKSIYRWQGKIESADEVLLLIKSTAARYPAVAELIQQLHPYDNPELIAVSFEKGLPEYLRWVEDSVC